MRSRSGLSKQSALWRKEGHPGPAEPLPTRGWLGETKLSCPGRGFSHLGTAPWARPPRTRRATGPHHQDSTGCPAHRPQPRGGARPSPGKQAGSASDLGSWPPGPSRPPGRVAHAPRALCTGWGDEQREGLCWPWSCPDCVLCPARWGCTSPSSGPGRGHLSPAHLSRALSWLPVQHLQGSLKARQPSRHQPPTPRSRLGRRRHRGRGWAWEAPCRGFCFAFPAWAPRGPGVPGGGGVGSDVSRPFPGTSPPAAASQALPPLWLGHLLPQQATPAGAGGVPGLAAVLGILQGPTRPPCQARHQGRVCCGPGALLPDPAPHVCAPWPGARWVAPSSEPCGGLASWTACWGCVSNSLFSLCSRCSKAMFSKSLDIAEAHPQFSKEDRYTPCPPIPRPPVPKTAAGLVAGLGLRCIWPSPLWQGNLPASRGRARVRLG